MNNLTNFYSKPTGLIYVGSRKQQGAGIFSTILRVAAPIARKLAPVAKKVGRQLLKRGANILSDSIDDIGNPGASKRIKQRVISNLKDQTSQSLKDLKEIVDKPIAKNKHVKKRSFKKHVVR